MYMLLSRPAKNIAYKNTFWKASFYHYVSMFPMSKCSRLGFPVLRAAMRLLHQTVLPTVATVKSKGLLNICSIPPIFLCCRFHCTIL